MNSMMLDLYQANNFDPADFVDDEDIPVEDIEIVEARESGFQDGFSAGSLRIAEVMGAPGIAGDGRRMVIALDLAAKAPDMSADAVAEYVCSMALDTAAVQFLPSADEHEGTAMRLGGVLRYGMSQAAQHNGVTSMAKVDQKAIYAARRKQTAAGDATEGGDNAVAEAGQPATAFPDPEKVYASRISRQGK